MTNSSPLVQPSELNLGPQSPNSALAAGLANAAGNARESATCVQMKPRTPAQIIAALDHYRQHMQSGIDERANEQREARTHPLNLSAMLLSMVGMAEEYFRQYRRSTLSTASTSSAPSQTASQPASQPAPKPASQPITQQLFPLLRFAAARPLWVGVGVGMAILIGPTRLVGWCGKAITLYRLASLVKSG